MPNPSPDTKSCTPPCSHSSCQQQQQEQHRHTIPPGSPSRSSRWGNALAPDAPALWPLDELHHASRALERLDKVHTTKYSQRKRGWASMSAGHTMLPDFPPKELAQQTNRPLPFLSVSLLLAALEDSRGPGSYRAADMDKMKRSRAHLVASTPLALQRLVNLNVWTTNRLKFI